MSCTVLYSHQNRLFKVQNLCDAEWSSVHIFCSMFVRSPEVNPAENCIYPITLSFSDYGPGFQESDWSQSGCVRMIAIQHRPVGWIHWKWSLLSSSDTFCIINKVILDFLVAEGEECWGKCWQGSQICSSLSPNSGHTPGSTWAHIMQTRAASGDTDLYWRKIYK